MGIISDHGIVSILKNKNQRNDPEIREVVCNVLDLLDADMDKVGELIVSRDLDKQLESLRRLVDAAENDENDEDEDEDLVEDDEEDNEEDNQIKDILYEEDDEDD